MGIGQTNQESNSSINYIPDNSPIQHQKERKIINDELAQIFIQDCSWDFDSTMKGWESETTTTNLEYQQRTSNAFGT